MKALILAAGLGTRLRPHTKNIPKPLFKINQQPVIDILIRQLVDMGITGVIINTHHRHQQISDYLKAQDYPIQVSARFEKELLGTGGAIKNVSDFLGDAPFLVINSDIISDIDIQALSDFHKSHTCPATLVMHDYPVFNNVCVDKNGYVTEFIGTTERICENHDCLAFTGIQILDPLIFDYIPESRFVSSIDVYKKMIKTGQRIRAYISSGHYWRDIGTPESYFEAVYEKTAPDVFKKVFGNQNNHLLKRSLLAGDGSDRKWYRVSSGDKTLVMVDHGINTNDSLQEVDSFIKIGRHLKSMGLPVPDIYHAERFSGVIYLEDLGDIHLQSVVKNETDQDSIASLYRNVIGHVIQMSAKGAVAFDNSFTYQTPEYDKRLILEKECQYFVDSFLCNYLEMDVSYTDLSDGFEFIADHALADSLTGFMHRDLQSRNIMILKDKVFLIDFQGGRIGPIQYDLASLLTDPYVNLAKSLQDQLLVYGFKKITEIKPEVIDENKFLASYHYCALSRIMQSLGAFGYLTTVKSKPFFEQFIPIALSNLLDRIEMMPSDPLQLLTDTVKTALNKLKEQ